VKNIFLKVLPWLIFGLFGFYLVGNNFSAKLGMIDDHEIAMFLGSDGKTKLSEIPSVIMTTEVGQWGTNLRYRPSYYTLRVIETALWRDNATAWYASRYVILVASMVLGYMILSIYFPHIVAYLFIFCAMTIPFWQDMLTRLGPSEIYALPALLLFIYGLIKDKIWLILIGYLICVGGKENLLILFPFLVAWVINKRKELKPREWIIFAIMAAFTMFIVGSILVATSRVGVDFYLNDISYGKRMLLTLQSIPTIIDNRHLFIPLILFALLSVFSNKKYFFLGISLLLAALSQYVFYNNKLPTNTRYDFPGLLLFPVFDLVIVKMMIEAASKYGWGKLFRIFCYAGLCLFMLAFAFRRGYFLIHTSAVKNVEKTTLFDNNLHKVETIAKENPDATLIYTSIHFADFEGTIAVSRYLTAMEVKNKMIIQYTREPKLDDTLGLQLESRMVASMNGEPQIDNSFERFVPLKELGKPCFTLSFYNAPALPECPVIANF
jgi:hypothetical protein